MSDGTIRFNRRQTPYTQISNAALRDKRLSLATRGLFALMLSLPQNKDFKTAYIMRVAGVGRNTLFRYMRDLEQYGYLKREQAHKKDGHFGTNCYFLDDEPESPCTHLRDTEERDTVERDTVKPCTENGDANKRTKRKNNTPYNPPEGESAELFARFWALYPKKRGKEAARRAWAKLAPDMALCIEMSDALKAQMKSDEWTREGGRYVPYPASWLNGRRWEDEEPEAEMRPDPPEEVRWGWGA